MTISVNITIALYVGYLRSNRDRMFEIDIIWGQNYRKKFAVRISFKKLVWHRTYDILLN